jgi:hypothetical protein
MRGLRGERGVVAEREHWQLERRVLLVVQILHRHPPAALVGLGHLRQPPEQRLGAVVEGEVERRVSRHRLGLLLQHARWRTEGPKPEQGGCHGRTERKRKRRFGPLIGE